ncbi:DUF2147 domain-containing protein [Roseibium litorale]|uniref:DUF2147 domain-containing protein n=1 Tax=Roseibium litorale TaxID=2803841 RepID=A0ABR9CH57_9HYPH|nr:DUF2147 domain-containing protein [Roseibium litorale]MBD8890049.1 DUF2147 domain-containing protein [Roseibium litorale]
MFKRYFSVLIHSRFAALSLMTLLTLGGLNPASAADILGHWKTPAGAVIHITSCGKTLCGKLTDFAPLPGYTKETATDVNHRDASKRNRKLLGLEVVWGVTRNGSNWTGKVYDPRRGFSAPATLKLTGQNSMNVKGCVRMVFNICEDENWQRLR